MAYKFQLGAAKLGGSITSTGGLSGSSGSFDSALAIGEGGTGGTTADAARTNLGLVIGTNVQAQDTGLQYLADLDITNESTFQEQVGLEIGVDVQAFHANLADIAALAQGDGNFIVSDGTDFVVETGNTARTSLGLGTGSNVQFAQITGSSGSFSGPLTVNGNLTVLGDTFSASVTTLQIQDALISIGDGQADFAQDYGIEFGSSGSAWASLVTDSDAGFDNLSSSLPLLAPSLATDDWSITSTHISGNLPVSASAFYGDGSGLTGISADSATSLRLAGANAIVNSNITASNDVNLVDTGAARTIEMPDITSATVGRVYIIKDIVGSAATNNITINDSAAGHDIDGETSITIESGFGAVNLLAVSGASGFSYTIF